MNIFAYQARSQNAGGLRKINGTKLFIETEGKGDHLLLIHGGPGLNHSYFQPHLKALSERYTLVYYDQRASGQSLIPSTDSISLRFFVEDIEAIRKMLGVDKLNILAHSWGSIPAVNYGLAHPDKVNRLILSNPSPLSKEYDIPMMEFVNSHTSREDSVVRADIMAARDFSIESITKLMKINFRASAYDKSKINDLNLNLPANFAQANTALFTGLGKDLAAYNWYEEVAKFNFPVMILQGKYDGIPQQSIDRLKKAMPGSRLVVFKKSGHFPFVEEPSAYAKAVHKFLR